MSDDESPWSKLALSWVGMAWGWFTLQHVVLLATFIYTVLQIYVLWRDKVRK